MRRIRFTIGWLMMLVALVAIDLWAFQTCQGVSTLHGIVLIEFSLQPGLAGVLLSRGGVRFGPRRKSHPATNRVLPIVTS